MKNQTRSLLEELNNITFKKDKESVVESRANHIIESAIRLLNYIKENFDADLTVIDMNKEVIIKDDWIESKCGWTPFNNYKVKGFPVATIVNGEIVMENNKIISPAKGKPLNFN